MVEYDRTQERELTTSAPLKICAVGVGGAGLNVLDRIALDRIIDATLIGMHTDVRVLSHAMTPHKLQLGADITRGIGSGGDPEIGRSAAESSAESIRSLVQGHDMVFLCAGLGGGTGSGALPVVARIARECGALVFVFATTPFSFEGRRRLVQAEMALEEIQPHADSLILFENNRMGELILPREGIQKAFSQADQLIGHSVRAISAMVTQPGLVRLGLSDLMTALRTPDARCLFGFGEARGANRSTEALKRALKSPLIHQGQLLQQAKNLIVHVAGGDTLTLAEVEGLMKQLGKHVPDQTQILFGISVDAKLGDSLALTLVSSLSAAQLACEIKPAVVESELAPAPAPVARQKVVLKPVNAEPEPKKADEFDLPLMNGTNGHTEKAPPIEASQVIVARQQPARSAPPLKTESVETAPAAEMPAPQPVAAKAPARQAPPPPPVEEEEPATLVKSSIFSVIEDEEDEEPSAPEKTPAPVSAVVPRPVGKPQVQPKTSFIPAPPDDEDEAYEPQMPATKTSVQKAEPALAAAGKASSLLQSTLNLHQEEIARFKGTDKTIVEGEDLDVPTWMRMRQKAKR